MTESPRGAYTERLWLKRAIQYCRKRTSPIQALSSCSRLDNLFIMAHFGFSSGRPVLINTMAAKPVHHRIDNVAADRFRESASDPTGRTSFLTERYHLMPIPRPWLSSGIARYKSDHARVRRDSALLRLSCSLQEGLNIRDDAQAKAWIEVS